MTRVSLGELMPSRVYSLNPSNFADEEFELWSIPAFDVGRPEIRLGAEIGSAKKLVRPDDVLLSRIVPHIRRAWVVSKNNGKRQIASGEWIVFRHSRFFPAYLRHVLISNEFHAQFMQTVAGVGGSLLRARPEGVKEIEIPLPPLPEQKRIAAILDQADALRRLRQRAIAHLDTLGQAIFREMFGRLSKHQPIRLNSIAELINGDRSSNYPSESDLVEEGIIFLSTKNIRNRQIDLSNCRYITKSKFLSLGRGKLRRGDIIMTLRGTLGQLALFDCVHETGFINAQMVIIRPRQDVCSTYLLEYLASEETQSTLLRSRSGSAVGQLTASQVGELSVIVPDKTQQDSYTKISSCISRQRECLQSHADASEKLFNSLQHRAFRGEL